MKTSRAKASMKALPKRKGNRRIAIRILPSSPSLNESPSQKEGKLDIGRRRRYLLICLNESPSQKEGKYLFRGGMGAVNLSLNESPSQKEGKCSDNVPESGGCLASMKALPKRKGNSYL